MNQFHTSIFGTRELSEEEARLLKQLRSKANALNEVFREVENLVTEQHAHAQATKDIWEMERLTSSEPFKWIESAKTNLQTSLMQALRAVAQPVEL